MRTPRSNTIQIIGALLCPLFVVPALAGDDHGDTCDTSTLVQPGVPVQGLMGDWPDEDWFAFDAVEGRLYYIDVRWLYDSYGNTAGEVHLPSCGAMFLRFDGSDYDQRPDIALIADQTGRYSIRLEWGAMYPGGPYQVLVTDLGVVADDHPDQREAATPIVADGSDVHASIDHVLDRDWFRTNLAGGMQYALDLRSELPCDNEYGEAPWLYLMADRWETERTLAYVSNAPNFDTCAPHFTTQVFAVPEARAGEIALRAEVEWLTGEGVGSYTFRVRPVAPIPPDDHPDTCENAHLLTPAPVPVPVAGVTYTDLDPDWFAFDAVAGRSYEFRLGGGNDSGLAYQVFAPGCTEVIGEGWQWARETYAFICPESGRYAIRVYHEWESGAIRPYTVAVTDFGDVPDDHGNGHGSATSLAPDGAWAMGVIEYAVDQDVFRVPMNENTVYACEIESLTGCTTMHAALEGDPSGRVVYAVHEPNRAGCYDSPHDNPVIWYYVGTGHAGDRFLRVARASRQPDELSQFRVRVYPVWNPKGDEHPDQCADAHTIEPGGLGVPGLINDRDDDDPFRFQAQAGHVYRVLPEYSYDSISPRVYFPDAAGSPACDVSAREYGARTVFAWRAGWYTISLTERIFNDGMPYQLRVIDDGPAIDDHFDTPQLGTWMPIDAAQVPGAINFDDDVDAFRVRLFPFNSYRMTLRSLSPCGGLWATLRGNYIFLSTPWYDCEGGSEVSQSFYVDRYHAGVDAIMVTGISGDQYSVSIEILSCSADLNADSRLDTLDFFLFLSRLFAGDDQADFNSDGRADSQDLFDFLEIYLTGC